MVVLCIYKAAADVSSSWDAINELPQDHVEWRRRRRKQAPGGSSFKKMRRSSGKEKAHKHKQFFPVAAQVGGGGLPTGWAGVSRPVARGQKFMCCVPSPRNINIFVQVPGREDR